MNWLQKHHNERKNKARSKALKFGALYDVWVETYARHARFERLGK